jgi:hypothetical protein
MGVEISGTVGSIGTSVYQERCSPPVSKFRLMPSEKGARVAQAGTALVAQGIEHRFPKPPHAAHLLPRKPNEFLAIAGE